MDKLDLKKQYGEFYTSSKKEVEMVNIPSFKFLMMDGEDARPDGPSFIPAIQALFPVAYKIKFFCKNELDKDFGVMPLEGLWWADDMDDFVNYRKQNWKYTLMIHQPDFVTETVFREALAVARKKSDNPFWDDLCLRDWEEGPSVQILHVGPFSEEHENIMKLHDAIEEKGYHFDGQVQKHHEIYLSHFLRTAPDKLKTVLRQSYKP